MARAKFLCDAERCIECNACVTACKNEHEVPWGINRRKVVTINDGSPGERSISVACMHCSDAPCMAVCPVDCFYQNEEGIVLHSKDLCLLRRWSGTKPLGGRVPEVRAQPDRRGQAAHLRRDVLDQGAVGGGWRRGVGHLPRARRGPWFRLGCLGLGLCLRPAKRRLISGWGDTHPTDRCGDHTRAMHRVGD